MKHLIINCRVKEVICIRMTNLKDKEFIKDHLDIGKIVMEIKARMSRERGRDSIRNVNDKV
jgi:hypothetical protein